MKKQPIKLLLCLMLIGVLVSCKNEKGETKNNENDHKNIVTDDEDVVIGDNQDADGPFLIKTGIITYETKTLEGLLTATNTLYFDSYGNHLKLVESIGAETNIYYFDERNKNGTTIFHGRKPVKRSMRQAELNFFVAKKAISGYERQEDEELLGKNCVVYANNAKSAGGESQHVYWMHKGVLMKEIDRLGTGYINEAVTFEEKDLDEDVFKLE